MPILFWYNTKGTIDEKNEKLKFSKNFLCKKQCQNKIMSHRLGKIFAKDTSDKGLLSNIYKISKS